MLLGSWEGKYKFTSSKGACWIFEKQFFNQVFVCLREKLIRFYGNYCNKQGPLEYTIHHDEYFMEMCG